MRLHYLVICLASLGLTACAHFSTKPQVAQQPLEQRMVKGLNSFYEQPNYTFSININAKLKQTPPDLASKYPQNSTLIDHYLKNQGISLDEQDKKSLSYPTHSNHLYRQILDQQTTLLFIHFINNTQLSYQGAVDFRNKKMNLNMITEYQGSNFSAKQHYPFLLDLNSQRIYMNAFDPKTATTKQKNAQAYYFDFSQYQHLKQHINFKELLNVFKESNRANYLNLIGQERIERITPTDAERKAGAVEKIRLYSNLETLLVKSFIFEAINKRYYASLFDVDKIKKEVDTLNSSKTSKEPMLALIKVVQEHYQTTDDTQTTQHKTQTKNDAPAVEHKARTTSKPSSSSVKTETEQSIRYNQCREIIQHQPSFKQLAECRLEHGQSVLDKEPKEEDISSIAYLFKSLFDDRYHFTQPFKVYDTGTPITSEKFAEILAKHKQDIDPLIKKPTIPLIIDVTLDKKERLVHQDIKADFNVKKAELQGTVEFTSTIANYGQAKVTLPASIAQAKPYDQHPFIQTQQTRQKRYDSSDTLEQRIAKQVYQQTQSYEKTYGAVFVALLNKNYPDILSYLSEQDLKEIALIYTYDYADSAFFKPSAQRIKEIEALKQKHQQQDTTLVSLGEETAHIVQEYIEQYQHNAKDLILFKTLGSKETFFAHLYEQALLEDFTTRDNMTLSAQDRKILTETAQILAKAYTADQNNTLSRATVNSLKEEHLTFINYDLYNDIYKRVNQVK